jgi:outer membrane protein
MSSRWRIAQLATVCCVLALSGRLVGAEPSALDRYLAETIERNLALKRAGLGLDEALAGLDLAKAQRWPELNLQARYTRNEGGRTTDIPVGGLLNPAYAALNELLRAQGRPANFPVISDQSIEFLRPREQDTRLTLSAPLYAPAIPAAIRARSAQVDAERYARETVARRLWRDATLGYLNWRRAGEALKIVDASVALLEENLRVNRALVAAGSVTQDRALRAEAELLAMRQARREAENAQTQARNYLNVLRDRPLDTVISADPIDALAPAQRKPVAIRSELKSLRAQTDALAAGVAVADAAFRPTLAIALDSGIQGEDYAFGPDANFTSLSLVLTWTLFDGGRRDAERARAVAARESAQVAQDELAAQIEFEIKSANDALKAAEDSIVSAEARVSAAAAAFAIARRKRDAGALGAIEFLDARTTLTAAELNFNLTRFDRLIRIAERDYAQASAALPPSVLR